MPIDTFRWQYFSIENDRLCTKVVFILLWYHFCFRLFFLIAYIFNLQLSKQFLFEWLSSHYMSISLEPFVDIYWKRFFFSLLILGKPTNIIIKRTFPLIKGNSSISMDSRHVLDVFYVSRRIQSAKGKHDSFQTWKGFFYINFLGAWMMIYWLVYYLDLLVLAVDARVYRFSCANSPMFRRES